MRIIIQRVSQASVEISGNQVAKIGKGLLVLLGIEQEDDVTDADYLVQKLVQMRIFSDAEGKMNVAINEVNGDIIIVSQFTLHASTKKGNRPSYIRAARPEMAIPLYHYFIEKTQQAFSGNVQTGEFGADMQVQLINDGPVTIFMDSKNRE